MGSMQLVLGSVSSWYTIGGGELTSIVPIIALIGLRGLGVASDAAKVVTK